MAYYLVVEHMTEEQRADVDTILAGPATASQPRDLAALSAYGEVVTV